MSAILVTGADLAPQALELLEGHEVIFAGKTPTEDDVVALCAKHNPVAIIVRYSKVGAAAMDAAPALRVISKHGSGTDTIDKPAAKARGIEVVAAAGANAAAVAELLRFAVFTRAGVGGGDVRIEQSEIICHG